MESGRARGAGSCGGSTRAKNICSTVSTTYLQKAGDPLDVVAYDTTALRLRPNRSKEALELFDRGALNEKALRRETGFEEDDAHDDESFKRWLLRKIAGGSANPEQVEAALKQLGITLNSTSFAAPVRESRPDPSLQDHPVREEPDRAESDRAAAALITACDAMVMRALERAGNRLKNRSGTNVRTVDPTVLHIGVAISAAEAARLLDGSWTMLPRLVERHGFSAAGVRPALDNYCRVLLTTGTEHDVDKMIHYLSLAGFKGLVA